MTNELEPCPFCGKQPLESDCCNTYRITCTDDDCPACNDNWFESEEDAINAWNTRYKRTCKREIVDGTSIRYARCSKCNTMLDSCDLFCRHCGREIVA